MEKFLNVDQYPKSRMYYGGHAGRKKGIMIDGVNWMIKYPQNTRAMESVDLSYTTSPLSEYIGSHIYGFLGIPVHETRLGLSEGKIVVACKDYTNDLPISTGILRLYDIQDLVNDDLGEKESARDSISSSNREHGSDLGELLYTLDHNEDIPTEFKSRFWTMFVIDAFISNSDRHNGNWGFYEINGELHLLPVYDNGNCLLAKHNENNLEEIIADEMRLNSILHSGNSAFVYRDKKVDLLSTIKNLGLTKQEKNNDLIFAMQEIIPKISEKMDLIFSFIDGIPEQYQGIVVMSDMRKEFYKTLLKERYEKILLPALIKSRETNLQQSSKGKIKRITIKTLTEKELGEDISR